MQNLKKNTDDFIKKKNNQKHINQKAIIKTFTRKTLLSASVHTP